MILHIIWKEKTNIKLQNLFNGKIATIRLQKAQKSASNFFETRFLYFIFLFISLLTLQRKNRCEIKPTDTKVFGQIVIYVGAKRKLHKYWNIISIFIGTVSVLRRPKKKKNETRNASKEIESMNLVRPSAEITFMIKKILKSAPKIHPSKSNHPRSWDGPEVRTGQRSWLSHIIISAHQFPLNLICHLAKGQCPEQDTTVLFRSSSS